MSAPTTRRRRHRGPDHTFLPALATLVDQATAEAGGHVLVRVEGPVRPDVNLGLKALEDGVHPFDELAGFEAPDDWTVFGLRTSGRAHHLDHPGEPRPMASTFLVDRDGREASVLRFGDEVIDSPGLASGTIPDTCRRILGLPTEPAPTTTELLWSTIWVDRILERWGQPDRRRDLTSSFAQLAILHPSVHAPSPPDVLSVADPASLARVARPHAVVTTWEQLRMAEEPLALPDGPLSPSIARWMDDGFYARWTLGAYPSLATAAFEVKDLLGRPLGPLLMEALVGLLESAGVGRAEP